jgi:glycerophosphoryl diester phosphodiesterase
LKPGERHSLDQWQQYKKAYLSDSGLDMNRSEAELQKHRTYLEARPIEWCRFFFPKYATAEFALFHTDFIKRVVANMEWYEVLSWARELGKDTVTMMVVLYLVLTKQKKFIVFVSSSEDAAIDLLMPYMLNLESNERIKAYYGTQKNYGDWEEGDFATRDGAKFIALGAGQSPRGKKNENIRPDCIVISDFDTDESIRNPKTVEKNFKWIEEALIPTRSISIPLMVLVLGNIIAKTCCVTLAAKVADHHDIINIRMVNYKKPDPLNDYKYGKSVWERNTEEMIDRVLSKISTKAAMQEYFNCPLSTGTIFPQMTWGKCPDIRTMPYLVAYADPATSNKDKSKSTSNSGGSYKAVFLMGFKDGRYYVYTGFLDQVTNAKFVEWFWGIKDYVSNRCKTYNYIENNTLQDPFYQQVFIPLFIRIAEQKKSSIGVIGDTRKKPEKFDRIEGGLEPLNRNGLLILNADEKDNPHMKKLEEQFELFDVGLPAPADGPDCIEGGKFILDIKRSQFSGDAVQIHRRPINKKRV